jgi:23S rRNA maturation mini-RNase III
MSSENLRRGLSKGEVEALRQEAWIGDAVLELYARRWVLEETNRRDVDRKVSFVRNAFLSHLGQPTRVEAEIGRRFHEGGLDAAFAWIAENLRELFLKQEANRAKKTPSQARKRTRRR